MHCPHCASILIEEADDECDVPPLGWRCTRSKGHSGPCAAIECPEDIALVERGMKRLRTTRAELTKKHGTPPEFAAAVYRTVPEFLSMDEARGAVDRYAKEWFECGDEAPNALGEGRERGILREASSGEAATSTDGLEGGTGERK